MGRDRRTGNIYPAYTGGDTMYLPGFRTGWKKESSMMEKHFIIQRKVLISMLFIASTLLGYLSYKQLNMELIPNAELPML